MRGRGREGERERGEGGEGGREGEKGEKETEGGGRERKNRREREVWTGQGHSGKAQLQRQSAVQHPRIYPRITQCYAFVVRYYVT